MVRSPRRSPPAPSRRRVSRRFLLGSRWTLAGPLDGDGDERHFEVVEVPRVRSAPLVLRAVLTGRRVSISTASLEDETRWHRGWASLADAPDQSSP